MIKKNIIKKPSYQISLALSGGGSRGIFHLGFIEALLENNVEIKAISGSSVGSIIGATISCGIKPKDALKVFKSKEFKNIFKLNLFYKSFFEINLDAKILNELFIFKDLSDTKIPFFSCAVDCNTHELLYFNKGNAKELVYASCAFYPLFSPIKYKNRILADSGLLDYVPIKPLLVFKYPIIGINIIPDYGSNKNYFKFLFVKLHRMFISAKIPKNIKKPTWCISPKEISSYKVFSFNNFQEKFDLGYLYGKKWCNENLDDNFSKFSV